MVDFIRPENGKGLSVHVGIPESPGLDDCPDVLTFGLQFALENPGGSPFGHLGQTLRREAVVIPNPVRKFKTKSLSFIWDYG